LFRVHPYVFIYGNYSPNVLLAETKVQLRYW